MWHPITLNPVQFFCRLYTLQCCTAYALSCSYQSM